MVLMGVSFWTGMLQWIKEVVLDREHNINPNDLDMLYLTDDVEDAVNYVNAFYKQGLGELQPNF